MAYKLPKDLRYKEKVFGNLTWRQTVYVGIGFCLGSGILLVRDLPLLFRIVSGLIVFVLSCLLAFTGLESRLRDEYVFRRTVSEAGYLDDAAFDFLEVSEVLEDGVVVSNNGCKYSFVEVEPVNLDVRSVDERNLILTQYEEFLDSLSFPIHINVRTVDALDVIDDHFQSFEENVRENVKETGNKSLEDFYNDYKSYWRDFIEENGIKKRKYYVIIPCFKGDKHVASEELERRTELVRSKLPQQLASKRMSKHEVTRMLASLFGDFVEFENHYFSPFTLSKRKQKDSN
jgi:hypothetical protein